MLPFQEFPKRRGTFGALEGGYSPPSDKLVDRASLLPIGQYEDGTPTLAWPGAVSPLVEMGRDQYRSGNHDDMLMGLPQLGALASAAYDPIGTAKSALSSAYDFLLRPGIEGAQRSLVAQEGSPLYADSGEYVSGATAQPLDAFNAASLLPAGTVGARAAGLAVDAAPVYGLRRQPTLPTIAKNWFDDARAVGLHDATRYAANEIKRRSEPGQFHYGITRDGRDTGFEARGTIDEDNAHVSWIGPRDALDDALVQRGIDPANTLGPATIRDLANAFRSNHPEVRSFSGHRVSGARRGQAAGEGAVYGQTVRFEANPETAAAPSIAINAASLLPAGTVGARAAGMMREVPEALAPTFRAEPAQLKASAPLGRSVGADARVYVSDGAGGVRLAPAPSQGFYPATTQPQTAATAARQVATKRPARSKGLPMDRDARYARANAMGFDTSEKLYHGTPYEFGAFDASRAGQGLTANGAGRGVYMTPSRGEARGYGSTVHELYINPGNQKVIDSYAFPDDHAFAREIDRAMDEGYDSVRFKDVNEQNGYGPQDQVVVVDPSRIRSTKAAFDPSQSGSTNLLAANPETAALPSLALNALERPQGIRAYHGSPYDFDRFSLDHIGKGEGAQAYGHGLYFAENEGVAKSYRDVLGGNLHSGKRTSQLPARLQDAAGHKESGGLAQRRAELEASLNKSIPASWRRDIEQQLSALDEVERMDMTPAGKMYEVNINAQPDSFLDWYLPLSQQNDVVRRMADTPKLRAEWEARASDLRSLGLDASPPTGESLLRALQEPALREAGIPGIRFLDQGSRAAGEGSHNYVVFDDSLIDIVRKYANPETGALPSLALNALERPQGIRAYHGSPHDFDRFDLSKIGTGEGGNTYGVGANLSASEDYARMYKDPTKPLTPEGGHMYEVNVRADKDALLDWDKPLSEQPEQVRRNIGALIAQMSDAELGAVINGYPADKFFGMRGGQFMWGLDRAYPGGSVGPKSDFLNVGPNSNASTKLKDAGIPGIRYVEPLFERPENYTIFDDSLIDIVRKYANPETAVLPSLALNQDDPDTSDILRKYALLPPDRPQNPPVNTIPRGAADPFDRFNDPWGEVPMIINNPFAEPPPPELPRLPRPLPFRLGPPTG